MLWHIFFVILYQFEFDFGAFSGLLGNNFLYVLEMARRNILQPGATIIPCRATMYAMGIQATTGVVNGFDFSSLNKYR